MNNQDLIEEVNAGWVLSDDAGRLVKQDYDTIPINQNFAVQLKTGDYAILKKTEKFDDEVLKKSEDYQTSLRFLQNCKKE